MREPTIKECYDEIKIDGMYAFWHFQWGGYHSHALLELLGDEGCFDVHVWHDGEFPSNEHQTFHYCDINQLQEFVDFVKRKQKLERDQ